ncbi:1-deoxy-D-xylulose-5-phosphate synthase [Motiliproteus sp. SC1-56]|uniref:1-deoxy-D-xylulose-5-phosphate synthase n=1 Tax=Motiliproteus sp. SC1-56 TaxID=2799565 RepID=UPI001A8CF615|nr:1-deoxy-D-xylulose-5-phosphate synthase [Motiliproteus sp. SC1-56]
MFSEIPAARPQTPLLDSINSPEELRDLDPALLPELARQLRAFLLYSVGQTGGHFGAGLGMVELTLALHFVYDTPRDNLIWDVGHQCYPHKVLTGRREQMATIRQAGGLAPFPKIDESPYDAFGTGHSSTSISAALGMALAHKLKGEPNRTAAIIGDGAMTGGMAFEALNHAAHTGADLLVILNDNDMSISPNEGGLAAYLAKNLRGRTEASTTAALFEALEFHYTGALDGHDLQRLLPTLQRLRQAPGPQFLHLITTKGKGFAPAEQDPVGYHAITKLPAPDEKARTEPAGIAYSKIFGNWLCDQAAADSRLVGITPAMCEGSGMVEFAARFRPRYFDVAIAEQHAITLAAGLACRGCKPVVAIYSTFLQRGYDQLIHDVALQKLDVLFAIDRAGLVGEDGPTHHGAFDLSFLSCIPELLIMTPADEAETRRLLSTGYRYSGPACVRYPRGKGPGAEVDNDLDPVAIGRARLLREGRQAALLNFGSLLGEARQVADALDLTLVDMRFVKPLDEALLQELAATHDLLVTLEEGSIRGGAGAGVAQYLQSAQLSTPCLNLGLPDRFISHGKVPALLAEQGLDAKGIQAQLQPRLEALRAFKP